MKSILVYSSVISLVCGQNRINGIILQSWNGQTQFDESVDGIYNDVKNAIDWGFNRIYIGSYNYGLNSTDKVTDQLGKWNQLPTSKRNDLQSYAASKSSKIMMMATGYPPNLVQLNVTDFSTAAVDMAKTYNFDGILLDMIVMPIDSYPNTQQNTTFLDFYTNASSAICQTFPGGVAHLVMNLDLGSWNFPYNTADPDKVYPTVYGEMVESLADCMDVVVLNYYQYLAPETQTDEVTLYQNSSSLALVNNAWNYQETALAEIIGNQPNASKSLFAIAKPTSRYGLVDPNDLKCWSVNTTLADEYQAGFVTWPFQSDQTLPQWADAISYCGASPTAVPPTAGPDNSSTTPSNVVHAIVVSTFLYMLLK